MESEHKFDVFLSIETIQISCNFLSVNQFWKFYTRKFSNAPEPPPVHIFLLILLVDWIGCMFVARQINENVTKGNTAGFIEFVLCVQYETSPDKFPLMYMDIIWHNNEHSWLLMNLNFISTWWWETNEDNVENGMKYCSGCNCKESILTSKDVSATIA